MNIQYPSVVQGLGNDDYHALSALGASGIKSLSKSPAHYFGEYLDPDRPARESTPAQLAGTLSHCILLEPSSFCDRYVVKPEGHDGRTTAGKAWVAENIGRIVVSKNQVAAAHKQSAAVPARSDLAGYLKTGASEVSAFWIDEETGIQCKCRPDWVHTVGGEGVILVDLKTCLDASYRGFQKAVSNYSYHVQAAWYSHGYAKASGQKVLGFVFACVESGWPHVAASYFLDDEAMAQGWDECRDAVQAFAQCLESGSWPGYTSGAQMLSLPTWMKASSEIEVEIVQ